MLSPRTERDYRQVVERWTREEPDPAAWVSERSSEAMRGMLSTPGGLGTTSPLFCSLSMLDFSALRLRPCRPLFS